MARLLSIASAFLALAGCTALAQGVCPTQLESQSTWFYVTYDGASSDDDAYFSISLTTLDPSNEGLDGCSPNPVYISQYANETRNSCSSYAAARVGSPTAINSGCVYEFLTNEGDSIVFNMSCSQDSLGYGDYADITAAEGGKNRTYITGYGEDFCTPVSTSTVTYTDGPTQTWTDGPTETWTDGPTETYTDGPTQTATSAPAVNYSYVSLYTSYYSGYESYVVSNIRQFLNVTSYVPYGTITISNWSPCADGSGNYTCVAAFSNETQAIESIYGGTHGYIYRVFNASWYNAGATNYTNVTFQYRYNSPSWLVSDIRSFLNVSSGFDCWGTLTAWCNSTIVGGNYTCNATFSNFTQAYLSYEGANRGYISGVSSATMPGYDTPSPAPYNPTKSPHSDTASAMGILIGAMAGLMIFLALVSLIYIMLARRRPSYSGDYEHLSEMNRANSNLKRM